MALNSGTNLGPYQIQAPLGAGGMGEVYRARDVKLDRAVAIKVLPDALARDPERLARFEREAKVLASLNHPNIAQIYGLKNRGRQHGRRARAGDGAGSRRADQRSAAARDRAELREADRRRARSRARERNRASRFEAGQHPGHSRRRRQGSRFWFGVGGKPRAAGSGSQQLPHDQRFADARGNDHGHRRVHEPGAGPRQSGRQAHRHLGLRRGAVRNHRGQAAVQRRHRFRYFRRGAEQGAGPERAAGARRGSSSNAACARIHANAGKRLATCASRWKKARTRHGRQTPLPSPAQRARPK